MDSIAIVMLGHDHLASVRSVLAAPRPAPVAGRPALALVHAAGGRFPYAAASVPGGDIRFDESLLRRIGVLVPPGSERCFVTSFGGDGPALAALSGSGRPFDFVLPAQPDLPLDADAEFVPYRVVCEALERWMLPQLLQLRALRAAVGGAVLCLEAPPPRNCGDIAGRGLRYKLWRAQGELLRQFCAGNDIEFLPVPSSSQDADGFLRADGHGEREGDADTWYGRLVFEQVERRFGAAFRKVESFA